MLARNRPSPEKALEGRASLHTPVYLQGISGALLILSPSLKFKSLLMSTGLLPLGMNGSVSCPIPGSQRDLVCWVFCLCSLSVCPALRTVAVCSFNKWVFLVSDSTDAQEPGQLPQDCGTGCGSEQFNQGQGEG